MEKPDALAVEQDELDKHNAEIATQTAEIQELIAACNATKVLDEPSNQQKILKKRLAVLRKILDQTTSDVDKASSGRPDLTLLQHYDEQFTDVKKELKDVVTHLFLLDMSNDDELEVMPSNLAELWSECALKLRHRLNSLSSPGTHLSSTSTSSKNSSGVKLPEFKISSFDGNLLHWQTFWEQFFSSVHDHSTLTNSEKLVCLKQSLKGGSARNIIEGLSHSGDNYEEAIQSLRTRYDRPHLIH